MALVLRRAVPSGLRVGLAHVLAMLRIPVIVRARALQAAARADGKMRGAARPSAGAQAGLRGLIQVPAALARGSSRSVLKNCGYARHFTLVARQRDVASSFLATTKRLHSRRSQTCGPVNRSLGEPSRIASGR